MLHMKRKMLGHKYEVSMIAAAVGFTATAAAVATVGAGVMAAGSLLGVKEAKQVGGLMMAGGGMAAGGAGLMAGGLGTLGTLSAGAQLVGGALQGVGILTGNNNLSNIGGLINIGGMVGTSMDSGLLSGKGIDSGVVKSTPGATANTADATDWGIMNTGNTTPTQAANASATSVNAYDPIKSMGGSDGGIAAGAGKAPGAMDNIMAKMEKYDKLINMGGGALKTMNENKTANDKLAWEREKFAQEQGLYNKTHTAVAIPGQIGVSAPATQRVVQSINPTNRLGLISAGQNPTGVVA